MKVNVADNYVASKPRPYLNEIYVVDSWGDRRNPKNPPDTRTRSEHERFVPQEAAHEQPHVARHERGQLTAVGSANRLPSAFFRTASSISV
jgi:hypothetical protein